MGNKLFGINQIALDGTIQVAFAFIFRSKNKRAVLALFSSIMNISDLTKGGWHRCAKLVTLNEERFTVEIDEAHLVRCKFLAN